MMGTSVFHSDQEGSSPLTLNQMLEISKEFPVLDTHLKLHVSCDSFMWLQFNRYDDHKRHSNLARITSLCEDGNGTGSDTLHSATLSLSNINESSGPSVTSLTDRVTLGAARIQYTDTHVC